MPASRALAAVTIALLTACGGDAGSPSTPTTPTTPTTPVTPVTPTAPVVATVSVTGTASVELGKTTQLTAAAADAAGAAISGKTFTWASANENVATVASTGLVTAKAAGTSSISATVDGKTGSLLVTVTAPVVASITVTGSTSLQAGATTKLTAVAKDAAGAAISSATVTWASSDSSMMRVSGDGTVTAVRIGGATITASSGGKSATLDLTSSLAPYTFSFPTGTSDADAQRIKDAVQSAHAFILKAMGRGITSPTTVTGAVTAAGCDSRSGNAAFTGAGFVTFCVANVGWQANGPIMRQKIAMHELFHVWQYETGWLKGNANTDGSTWIVEGSAELMGFLAADAAGLVPIATGRGCQVKQAADFNSRQPPGLPPLSQVETPQAFQSFQGPLYTTSMLAMDQLTTAKGVAALKTYGDALAAGVAWQTAFQTAFGQSTTQFYAQFPGYFSSLAVPLNYLCGI